jgi:hypothetical protein
MILSRGDSMVNVEIELNKHEDNEEYCSPCLMVTEDNSEERCPIILPEYMKTVDAIIYTDKLKIYIEENFKTVFDLKKFAYGL